LYPQELQTAFLKANEEFITTWAMSEFQNKNNSLGNK
jgi:hypothetical protein